MPDESNPSTAPKIGGDDKAAANKSGNEGDPKPDQKGKPRKRQSTKWLGLTNAKWRELAGFAVLIPWIYNDLSDAHNFVKLFTLAASLAIAQGVVASFFKNRSLAVALWLISLIPLSVVVFENSRPESSKNAKLLLGFAASGAVTNVLWLTNEFLISTNNSITFSNGGPWVTVPVLTNQTTVSIWLQLWNETGVDADSPEVRMIVAGNSELSPDFGWSMVRESDRSDLTWRESALLSKEPQFLPRIVFNSFLPFNNFGPMTPVSVEVRAKNAPLYVASFFLSFLPESPDLANASNALHFAVFPGKNIEWGTNGLFKFTYPHD